MSDDKKNNEQNHQRRNFLKISGAAIAGVATTLIGKKIFKDDGEATQASSQSDQETVVDRTYSKKFSWSHLSYSRGEALKKLKHYRFGEEPSNPDFYKMVVIGSGYGASATAYRASKEFGEDLAILERGREWAPGDYPNSIAKGFLKGNASQDGARNFRTRHNPLGLWDLTVAKQGVGDLDVVSGNALGGTSTVNANIALEPLPEIFTSPEYLGPQFFKSGWRQGFAQAFVKKNPWKAMSDEISEQYPDKTFTIDNLRPYMDEVREMLQVETFPDPNGEEKHEILKSNQKQKALPKLLKVERMKEVWSEVFDNNQDEAEFKMVPMAVNLTKYDGKKNHQGVYQQTCTMCGDCVTGCNVGAKNTLIMNYLPAAKNNGAQIFTQMEVEYIEKVPGGYKVVVAHHDVDHNRIVGTAIKASSDELLKTNQIVVFARSVVVAAGAVGSSKILMRSRLAQNQSIKFSDKLGQQFSGNADILGFGYGGEERVNAAGYGVHGDETTKDPVGPCIVSMIDMRHNPKKGFLIEEGSFPHLLVSTLRRTLSNVMGPRLLGKIKGGISSATENYGEAEKIVKLRTKLAQRSLEDDKNSASKFAPKEGSFSKSMCNLAMGYDSASGQIMFDGDLDSVQIKFKGNGPGYTTLGNEVAHVQANKDFERMADYFGSLNIPNFRTNSTSNIPFSQPQEGGYPVSVHALGGCNMGVNRDEGVVDHKCRVFDASVTETTDGSDPKKAVHHGLYVTCGAAIPTSTGSNPFLTITSVATRAADLMFNDNIKEDELLKNVIARAEAEVQLLVKTGQSGEVFKSKANNRPRPGADAVRSTMDKDGY